MDLGLTGRRALVLGSSSGLGRAVAAALAAEGARVAVVSRDPERSAEAAAATGAATGLVADLTNPGAGAQLVTDAVAALAGLDIVVVNTGGGKPGPITATDGADDAAYHSMLRPVLEVSRAAAPHVTAGGPDRPGRLVYLTARSVVEATPELALSSVFRSGVAAAARSLALELAPAATVNVVVTGQFDTPALGRFEAARAEHEGRSVADVRAEHVASTPMGRLGTADEFADVVAFLCSARSSFVTGAAIRVDGGAVRGF
jgi:NAD(P)-dependent dehydrogenase (short-subunit alcohol dehydrogenase family)